MAGLGLWLLLAASVAVAGPPVKVESAEPSEAEQGTVGLDVTIRGRGFDEGSVAAFLVTGTENPGGVVVNNTLFVDSRTLVATIDVGVEAVVGPFDIEVVTQRGRRGKGTETFAVLQQGGGSNTIVIVGTLRDAASDRLLSDGSSYTDEMPGTGNLVFQNDPGRTFKVLLSNDPETIEQGACDDNPAEVCLRDGSTRVAAIYDAGFLAINKLDNGEDCDGNPVEVWARDMFAGECIKSSVTLSWDHPGAKPRVQMRLRCGKHPHEGGDRVRVECLSAHSAGGCGSWDIRPFLDGGGSEHLTCQLYHRARKGNEQDLELAEYDIVFGMTVVRQ